MSGGRPISFWSDCRFIDEVIMAGFNRIDTDAYDYYVGVYDDRNHGKLLKKFAVGANVFLFDNLLNMAQ